MLRLVRWSLGLCMWTVSIKAGRWCPPTCSCSWNSNSVTVKCHKETGSTVPDLTKLPSGSREVRVDLRLGRMKFLQRSDFPKALNITRITASGAADLGLRPDVFYDHKATLVELNIRTGRFEFDRVYTQVSDLKMLRVLTLRHTDRKKKRKLYKTLFQGSVTKSLRSLNLDADGIQHVDEVALGNLVKLKELSLAWNYLVEIPDFFSKLPLTALDLHSNNISTLQVNSLPRKTLEHLYMSSNRIATIDDPTFCNFSRLSDIHLSNNPKLSLPISAFKCLSKVYLKLDSTGLADLLFMDSSRASHYTLDVSDCDIACDCKLKAYLFERAMDIKGSCNDKEGNIKRFPSSEYQVFARAMDCDAIPLETSRASSTTSIWVKIALLLVSSFLHI